MPPTSFDIGFSLNPCPRKLGAPHIGEDEAVKPDGEPFLILAGDSRRGSDRARAARDHNPLPVG